jgi:hypothetical protein
MGVAPALLGLGSQVEVEASAHYAATRAGRPSSATAKGALHGVAFGAVPRPLDVTWDIVVHGDGDAIGLTKARVAVGPLAGDVHGTLASAAQGFRADLTWQAGPVPCTAFDTAPEPMQPDLGYALRRLAQDTGLATIRGDVRAIATLGFDSRDPGATTFRFTPQATCDVALRWEERATSSSP